MGVFILLDHVQKCFNIMQFVFVNLIFITIAVYHLLSCVRFLEFLSRYANMDRCSSSLAYYLAKLSHVLRKKNLVDEGKTFQMFNFESMLLIKFQGLRFYGHD